MQAFMDPCPVCGQLLGADEAICPQCGHEWPLSERTVEIQPSRGMPFDQSMGFVLVVVVLLGAPAIFFLGDFGGGQQDKAPEKAASAPPPAPAEKPPAAPAGNPVRAPAKLDVQQIRRAQTLKQLERRQIELKTRRERCLEKIAKEGATTESQAELDAIRRDMEKLLDQYQREVR